MSPAVEKAKKRLEDAQVFQDVAPLWSTISWTEKPTQMTALEAEYYAPGTIIVYPGTGDETLKTRGILRALGRAIEDRMPDEARKCWDNLYALAEPDHVEGFQAALKTNPIDYRSIVYGSQDPVVRLTYIHLGNALIANNVGPREADNLDIKTWPPTEEFAGLRRAYSLIPLVSAYWQNGADRKFCDAFAAWVDDGMMDVYHSAVRKKLIELIQTTVKTCCGVKTK